MKKAEESRREKRGEYKEERERDLGPGKQENGHRRSSTRIKIDFMIGQILLSWYEHNCHTWALSGLKILELVAESMVTLAKPIRK